ncbi:MAG: glycoside hydrolase family 2 protein [Crocinitomicaceae bacterium]
MSSYAVENIELDWDFFHPVRKEWMPLGSKGTVQEALIASGELPDPFYGTNENRFGWMEQYKWEFKSILVLDSTHFNNEYLELEFGNVDTYATIEINGVPFLKTANAFIPHRGQAKHLLKVGVNEITVTITPPVLYHEKMWDDASYHLPAPNDPHPIAVAPYTRKPQYQFGWDWALRMNTIGFNKPAKIFMYDHNRIVNKSVNIVGINQVGAESEEAIVDFTVFLAVPNNETYVWAGDHTKEKAVSKEGIVRFRKTIGNPQYWWPRGQGDPYLYTDEFVLAHDSSEVEMPVSFEYGVKTVELVQETDEWGTSYFFKINGRKIFAKGGNYIPQDIFPARVKDADIEEMVETMAASNFNMVRVWGGGYYPDEVFYETCDRLGLMVWQDLMFACAMYPGDNRFVENISEEFNYQVPRIAGHASVVQFNGNNEVEVAWGNWGFQIKYGLYGKSAKEIEAAYDRVFKDVAPTIINQYTAIPYIHTSPLSNWGKPELYNHGSQHYWGVWHGKDPIQDFGKKIGRFNAEYGFQSFPEYSSLQTFSDTSQWDLSSEVMKHHQKSYVGNNMILKHAKKLYGTPADFEEFVYYSQLTQSMAVSMAVAGHRVDFPRCGGTLYWQVNDCWPAPTWSGLDYFNNWKALQYRIRDDYKEVTMVETYEDLKTTRYYLVSGVVDTFECHMKCEISNEKGKWLSTIESTETLQGMEQFLFLDENDLKGYWNKNIRLDFTWNDAEGNMHSRSFDRFGRDRDMPTCDDVRWEITSFDTRTRQMTVKVENKKYLRDFWLYCHVPGVVYDRNFVSLSPGEHTFVLKSLNLAKDQKFEMRWH